MWTVEFTDDFGEWWEGLAESEQDLLDAAVETLEERGPALGRPLADTVSGLAPREHEGVEAGGEFHPRVLRLRPAPGGDIADRPSAGGGGSLTRGCYRWRTRSTTSIWSS